MKRYTPRTIAQELEKLPVKLQKAQKEVDGARHWLEYLTTEWHKLPSYLEERRAELQAAEDRATEARADLTKPLDSYHYTTSGHYHTRRRYASPLAQKAWEAERAAGIARSGVEGCEANIALGENGYLDEARASLAAAESELSILIGTRDNLIALASKIMGKPVTAESLIELAPKAKPPVTESPLIELPAREVKSDPHRSYIVLAENIALKLAKAKEFSVNGMTYFAKHVREWARLEDGQVTVTIGPAEITFRSKTARMTVKAQGDKAAPVMTFVTG